MPVCRSTSTRSCLPFSFPFVPSQCALNHYFQCTNLQPTLTMLFIKTQALLSTLSLPFPSIILDIPLPSFYMLSSLALNKIHPCLLINTTLLPQLIPPTWHTLPTYLPLSPFLPSLIPSFPLLPWPPLIWCPNLESLLSCFLLSFLILSPSFPTLPVYSTSYPCFLTFNHICISSYLIFSHSYSF